MNKFTRWPRTRRPHRFSNGRYWRPALEALERRDLLSLASLLAVGAGAGGGPQVTVLDRATGGIVQNFFAYDPGFTGGVRLAVGDVNGDGTVDVVTAPGPGGGPQIKVFDGKTGNLLNSFFAFDPGFASGVNVALGDVNGDHKPDVIVGADAGGGPQVRVFDGATLTQAAPTLLSAFFAFDPGFNGGVRVAAGDVNGDGKADVVVGAGPGGGPQVRVFDGATLSQAAPTLLSAFFAYDAGFNGGVNVAATDLNADGKADLITGPGAGGGPQVRVFDGATGNLLSAFFAYEPAFTGGVQVGAFSVDAFGRAGILTAPGAGGGLDMRIFDAPGGVPAAIYSAFAPGFSGGGFVAASGLPAALSQVSGGVVGNFFGTTTPTGPALLTLNLNPLDINLLGLEVQTNQITVTVTPESGSGKLLGNVLTIASNLINFEGVNTALNNVLGSVVNLLNSASLVVNTLVNPGPLSDSTTATTPVLDAFIAPVHLYLLGAHVDTTPIHLTITAHSGSGLILGNVVADLANLFNPPLPNKLKLDDINKALQNLLDELNAQLPGITPAPVTNPPTITDTSEVLRLTLAPINVNLLGLILQTSQIQVNADVKTGNGLLLGNVLTTLLNTLGATPQDLTNLNNILNGILAKVIGVLNASNLILPPGIVGTLSQVLQELGLPNLVNTTGTPDTVPVLNLDIASTDGTTPPVDVQLLGLIITTSNIHAQLVAQTGDGQILGNLVYNVSHLLDPGGSLNLLTILNLLGV